MAGTINPILTPGSIVWADVLDPDGENPKIRPLVIVQVASIEGVTSYGVVGISSTYTRPLTSDEIELPYSSNPRSPSRTKLTLPCVAKLKWRLVLDLDQILKVGGRLPAHILEEIQSRLGI
jgi:hypothetical protein